MNEQQNPAQLFASRDQEIRAALEQHWAASDANDSETEHAIYHDDAVLDYPQSGERTPASSVARFRVTIASNNDFPGRVGVIRIEWR